jgi:hypothetical protein
MPWTCLDLMLTTKGMNGLQITLSGAVELTSHRKPAEYAPIDDLYNPTIHRINQAIRARAVNPDSPISPPAEILLRYSKPPEKLIEKAKSEIDALIDAAEIKKGLLPISLLLRARSIC